MKRNQKIIFTAITVLLIAGLVMPFLPIGRISLVYDFNNGMLRKYSRYFWGHTSVIEYPSLLGSQLIRLKMNNYPKLEMELNSDSIIIMKRPKFMSLPMPMDSKMMKMNYGPNMFPKLTSEDLLTFRDEMLNEFATPEIIEEAKRQGALRGGYMPNAFWERQ